MISLEIIEFRNRLNEDVENREMRRQLHENYEWLESYWQRKFNGNNGEQNFCNNHGDYYWEIDDIKTEVRKFVILRPVGSSKNNFEPTENILRATYHLKYHSNLFEAGIIKTVEQEIEIGHNWNQSSFKASFEIIRQIRNNLFHGRKVDLNPRHYNRNKELVKIASNFTRILLDNLIEAEYRI